MAVPDWRKVLENVQFGSITSSVHGPGQDLYIAEILECQAGGDGFTLDEAFDNLLTDIENLWEEYNEPDDKLAECAIVLRENLRKYILKD